MFHLFLAASAIWLTKIIVGKTLAVRSATREISAAPSDGVLWIHPFRALSMACGHWFPFPSQIGSWDSKFRPYVKHGSTAVGSVLFSRTMPTLWLADAEGIKTVAGEATVFQKDIETYKTVNIYGENLVGTEGAEWRRHRRVAKPAFNEACNAFVWTDTVRIVNEWFAALDAVEANQNKKSITLNVLKDLAQVTLLVISSVGFGRRASWQQNASTVPPPGQLMAFGPAVFAAVHYLFPKALTPKWLSALSERMYIPVIGRMVRDVNHAYEALKLHMVELVSLSRAWVVEGKVSNMDAALLRNLVEANMEDEDAAITSYKNLTDDELFSNTFLFLLAGHETTAHSLAFAVAYLALYPDVQQKIYDEAFLLWPDGVPKTASTSSYGELMPRLLYTLATFHETIRLFPPVIRISKLVHADTTIKAHRFTTTSNGDIDNVQDISVPVKAGSMVLVDIRGLHMNPMYWGPDAESFKPERFIDTESYKWPRDAFLAFSAGPRACIGQRFAVTESVCVLASLVRTYEISVPEKLRAKPFEEQKRSLLSWIPGITMAPTNCVVSLRRRS
ncbi:cytochrome P450 [Mycena albidolilacea]|uniref:Cytochrome P450 n=1 Tax=Mycena albidolilacea TaxID=1033008 RepID=A0AAD7AIH8_9AGAR|nr:cytochrome P450 [Mycena albidolilacea]